MKRIIEFKLKILAKLVLAKYKPKIIGITGCIGKTSAKEAIFAVLSRKFSVRRNLRNYNNEIGVPLTILGFDSPGKSLLRWLILFLKSLALLVKTDVNYPKILVLEMGVDRPGDMKYLNGITGCDIGVITAIAPVHLEFFGTLSNIQKEKGLLIKNLKNDGWAILNYDNDLTGKMKEYARGKILTFGFEPLADIRAQEVIFNYSKFTDDKGKSADINDLVGVSFKLSCKGSSVPVLLPQVIGQAAVYSSLAGAAVGLAFDMNLVEIAESLKSYTPPPGRMNLIRGINDSLVVDDTYNSSPEAVIAGLDVIKEIVIAEPARKIAVLGDMLELGSYSQAAHEMVGSYLVKCGINKLITVGARSLDISKAAAGNGLTQDSIFHFADSEMAGKFLCDLVNKQDLVFIKGSQGMRMEKAVKAIMLEPERASELLVRQSARWLSK